MNSQTLFLAILIVVFRSISCEKYIRNGLRHKNRQTALYDEPLDQTPRSIEELSTWTDCIGLTVKKCKRLIKSTITDTVIFQLVTPDEMLTEEYLWNRIRIYHDDSSPDDSLLAKVIEPAPKRG
mmetsp:Transcript_28484/g.40813  ORF Transcript_28484/g.40813 Transcript_28484/m.40813 type:complete len:124 (+) Transcript_28484:90-461(+)